jgi:hypothetical protein
LSACADGYGYGGIDAGYGSAGYYDGYGAGYPGYGYAGGYAPSYFGWYGDYYYPGTGVYVYDRNRRAHRWNDRQRSYWSGRRGNGRIRDNWADFRRDYRSERRDYRGDLRQNRQAYRDGTIDRGQFRDGRRAARQEFRRDVNRQYRQTQRENRGVRQGGGVGDRPARSGFGARGGGRGARNAQ